MSKTRTIGTTLEIGSTFGATKSFTDISNADPAVFAFATGHGLSTGDFFEVLTIGGAGGSWGKLERRVFRAIVSGDNVTAEGLDTSTSDFPAGTIAGTARAITAWTAIDQRTRDFTGEGGRTTFHDVSTIDDADDKSIPGPRSASTRSWPGYHDASRGWVDTVRTAADTAAATPVREIYPNASRLVASAYWSFHEIPTPQDGTLRDLIELTFAAKPTVYAT